MKNFSALSNLPFYRYKIVGHSMLPTLKPGQIVWVFTWAYILSNPKPNDIVVLKINDKEFIKRIYKVNRLEVEVTGDNKGDSLKLGQIPKKDILGKVLI